MRDACSGPPDEDREQLRAGLAVWREMHGESEVCIAAALEDLALRRIERRDFRTAEVALRECLTIRRRSLGGAHESTARTVDQLGGCLIALDRYEDAERLFLLDCEEACSEREGHEKRTSDALLRIVALYELCGRTEEAARWRQRLPAVPAAWDAECSQSEGERHG